MLDRTLAPRFGKIDSIPLMQPKLSHLDNGVPVFRIDAGTSDVVKLQLVFPVGSAAADRKLVASATAQLLRTGTVSSTEEDISEALDLHGAYLREEVTHDETSLELYTLNDHLEATLKVFADVLNEASFPKNELETFCLKGKQDLMVSEQKVGYLAAKAFSGALYGKDHPYGRSANADDYTSLKRSDLTAFHEERLLGNIRHIIISGRPEENTMMLLNQYFGQDERRSAQYSDIASEGYEGGKWHVEKDDAVQNAIRIGRVLFNRTHPDFIGMQILCTVLGGYFGSRLMRNIREDKGYTYGIGAGMVSLKHSGYMSIHTEVGSGVSKAALDEIHLEIDRLRKEPVPIKELELVRNYMLGTVMKSLDGPFHIASKWKTYLKYGLGVSDHDELIHQIETITSERLQQLAQKYLQREAMVEVTAGVKPTK